MISTHCFTFLILLYFIHITSFCESLFPISEEIFQIWMHILWSTNCVFNLQRTEASQAAIRQAGYYNSPHNWQSYRFLQRRKHFPEHPCYPCNYSSQNNEGVESSLQLPALSYCLTLAARNTFQPFLSSPKQGEIMSHFTAASPCTKASGIFIFLRTIPLQGRGCWISLILSHFYLLVVLDQQGTNDARLCGADVKNKESKWLILTKPKWNKSHPTGLSKIWLEKIELQVLAAVATSRTFCSW